MSKGATRALKAAKLKGSALGVQTIPFNVTLALTDGNPGRGTAVIRGLPQGNLLFFGAVAYVKFQDIGSNLIAAFAGDFSVGTVPTADADLADSGEADIIASTELLAAAGVTPRTRSTTTLSSGVVASPVLIDNTAGDLELNLNVLIDDASISGAGSLRAKGTLFLSCQTLGDD